MPNDTNGVFFWLDLEMTGLDPQTDRILEAAWIVTDKDFNELATYDTAIYQEPETLAAMNDWCKKTHTESGLVDRVASGIGEDELEEKLLDTLAAHFGPDPVLLAGNSIGQDRKFVDRYLPKFSQKLHYRMLDVSSFKVVFQTCYGKSFSKKGTHRALDDIRESIGELRYYLSFMQG
ncbi:oligoribonuclease [Ruficoccus amylovorans]|uniref:Oligoribonuclease n=1 Tax=Ruficoccus amylovorans TaxID=1804625 RepID=A0A842HC36_9BACT|nr:oligoribonuclease [Ruficoccus amylovorans]MBC2594035.1 oligoribonuclease [Ruficoccus amylovorans]